MIPVDRTGFLPAHGALMAYLDGRGVGYSFNLKTHLSSGPTTRATVVMANARPWLVLAAETPDLDLVARAVGAKKAAVATRSELMAHGLAPEPSGFGRFHGVQMVLDESLLEHWSLRVPTGVAGLWVELDPEDIVAMERPVVAAVTGERRTSPRLAPVADVG